MPSQTHPPERACGLCWIELAEAIKANRNQQLTFNGSIVHNMRPPIRGHQASVVAQPVCSDEREDYRSHHRSRSTHRFVLNLRFLPRPSYFASVRQNPQRRISNLSLRCFASLNVCLSLGARSGRERDWSNPGSVGAPSLGLPAMAHATRPSAQVAGPEWASRHFLRASLAAPMSGEGSK